MFAANHQCYRQSEPRWHTEPKWLCGWKLKWEWEWEREWEQEVVEVVGAVGMDMRECMWEWMVSGVGGVGAGGGGGGVCSDSCMWRGVGACNGGVECGGRPRARAPNKGFARRPQESLAWGE